MRTAPCWETSSISACPACGRLWMSARRYHDERCQKRLAAASASAWVASSRSRPRPVRRVGVRVQRLVGTDVRAVERLRRRPDGLAPEPQRLALVLGQAGGRPVAGEDREDRDVLAQLAQAGDQPAAGERDVVGVGGDEDVGHGPASIPIEPRGGATCSITRRRGACRAGRAAARRARSRGAPGRAARPVSAPSPTSGTKTQAPWFVVRRRLAVALHQDEVLLPARPDRDHEPAAVGQLDRQRVRDARRRGRHQDSRPGRPVRDAGAPVADPHLHRVAVAQLGEPLRGPPPPAPGAARRWSRGSPSPRARRPGNPIRSRCRARAARARDPAAGSSGPP